MISNPRPGKEGRSVQLLKARKKGGVCNKARKKAKVWRLKKGKGRHTGFNLNAFMHSNMHVLTDGRRLHRSKLNLPAWES